MFQQPSLPFSGEMVNAPSLEFESNVLNARSKLAPGPEDLILPTNERIETPTDERGLVNIPLLLEEVKNFVRPDYEWRGKPNSHHIFWYEKLYTDRTLFRDNVELSRHFRNMPLHQIELPVELHDFLHVVTTPVEVPSDEIMEYRVESWDIVCNLFNSVTVLQTHRRICDEQISRQINKELVGTKMQIIKKCVDRADKLPDEFQLAPLRPFQFILGIERLDWIPYDALNKARKSVRRYGKISTQGALRLHQQDLLIA